ncbi:hypothetical protein [Piscirickettsia salmonis]|uniref:hypothetical protein n=2 Tax=Piscirickettsia salmonis TaxID=1238 RepID=UPI003EC0328B
MECADSRHATLCDADSRGFIVVAFCSAILHHWMCKIPTEVATLTLFENIEQVLNDESRYCFIKVEDVTGPLLEKTDPKLDPPVATLIKDFTMRNGDVAIAESEICECDL